MKILLVGEYSGLFKTLKEGLVQKGHEVTIISDNDGFKNIKGDCFIGSKFRYTSKFDFCDIKFKALFYSKILKNYDIVQFINPFIFPFLTKGLNINRYFIENLVKNNGKSFLTVAGWDSLVWEYFENTELKLKRHTEDLLKYDGKGYVYEVFKNKNQFKWNKELAKQINGIIPIMYEYDIPYDNLNDYKKLIRIPINTDKLSYEPNIVKNKITFFHGLNRIGSKGTHYIAEAFEMLKKKYPNDVNTIIAGRLPYNEYLNLINKSNVVIDQTSSYSLGINGLIALAKGKIVMGGAELFSFERMGYDKSPVINITPNSKDIYKSLLTILEQKENMQESSIKSRNFIEEYHNYHKIAQEYLDFWNIKKTCHD